MAAPGGGGGQMPQMAMSNMGGMPPQMAQQQMMQPGMQQVFHMQPHLSMPHHQQQQLQGQHLQPQQPMMQANMQQIQRPPPPQQAPQQPAPQPDITPVLQSKLLLPQLKEALTNLMKVVAHNIHQNGLVDGRARSSDTPGQKLDKYLEEFYSVCDQMELTLRLAIECNNAHADSSKHTPLPVQTVRQDPGLADTQTYTQFLTLTRLQAQQAGDIRQMLMEGVRKLNSIT